MKAMDIVRNAVPGRLHPPGGGKLLPLTMIVCSLGHPPVDRAGDPGRGGHRAARAVHGRRSGGDRPDWLRLGCVRAGSTDEGLRAAPAARRQVPGLPILILSTHVEQLYARELLADQAGGVGYLLKDRVFTDEQFTDAIRTVARGRTIMDPEVVAKLLARRSNQTPVTRLTAREREVLGLMAGGRSNSAIAQRLVISEKAVSKHCTSIFAKLGLPPSQDDDRRVLAVLAYLDR